LGLLVHRRALRRCLLQIKGNQCETCKQSGIWNNQPLTLVVDHIDGNAGNNLPSNLRLLCPNCNSQTPTFCGRNLGKGRGSRGLSES
jgi:5-methylcytosine-specific restriction endonuclease McrA